MTVNDIYPGAPAPQKTYSVLLEGPESTVCAEAPNAGNTSSAYQSEAELEDELIHQLVAQGYERADIADEAAMVANLRARIERLNRFAFTDADWDRFFREHIARENDGIVDKTPPHTARTRDRFHLGRRHDQEHHVDRPGPHIPQRRAGDEPVRDRRRDP